MELSHLLCGNEISLYDHDPDATAATIVTPDGGTTLRTVDMRDISNLAMVVMKTVGTGAISLVEIVASTSSDMSSPVVIKSSAVTDADAVGDQVALEINAAEVSDKGDTLRYVAGRLTQATAGDEACVAYVAQGRHSYDEKTPDSVVA